MTSALNYIKNMNGDESPLSSQLSRLFKACIQPYLALLDGEQSGKSLAIINNLLWSFSGTESCRSLRALITSPPEQNFLMIVPSTLS